MNNRFNQIGFNQRIRFEWLEYTANQALAGNSPEDIKSALQRYLTDKLSVGNNPVRGNREKAITILMKLWVQPYPELKAFSEAGLQLFPKSPEPMHLTLHWGMAMAAYPFWRVVNAHVGRLLKLQGNATAAQVQQRIREQYGERETVFRAARRILRCLHDWEVLQDTQVKGTYKQGKTLSIKDSQIAAWLIEALLYATESGSAAMDSLLTAPAMFPFQMPPLSADQIATASGRIELVRHGVDESLLMIAKGPKTKGRRKGSGLNI